ncbi:hypothetical protein I8752_16525 [Nostocaceae cyanobacterium CENA369]|uniref:Uncharacterized protein n=1 Tax=Dendronalium phyllosphericum CENA369 TaxID=1725256 RepID=A0A8J7I643_9NOST|nr:hypothetical protein [Dendronalium phyllosphericum]MBH8574598.1 hypothetical protein [Dendronalium phyllosphericum CENA369]
MKIKDFYQSRDFSLFHSSAFQGVTRILNISLKKITVECIWQELTAQQQGQFPIRWYNPYTLVKSFTSESLFARTARTIRTIRYSTI